MAPNQSDHRISAFGGRPLERLGSALNGSREKLALLGITDAEQLVAIIAVEGMSTALAERLGLTTQELRSLVQQAQDVLPDHIASAIARPMDREFSLGALKPTEESIAAAKSLMKKVKPPAMLPSSVNHAGSIGPAQDQGRRGTCVSFASTALHEYFDGRRLKFSEQFLYEEIKRIDGYPEACGTWLVYAVQVLAKLGQCREADWSYNPNEPCNHNGIEPPDARAKAASYRARGNMLNPKDVIGIKTALAGDSNVAFCITVYDSWYRSAETARSGRITMRIGNEPPLPGGHCMCFIGYQDDPRAPGGGYFILRNSWGPNIWGYQCPYGAGNGTIPYQYIANDATEAASMQGRAR
jgi:hypothetical protein